MNFQYEDIEDQNVKENFRRLDIAFRELPFIDGTWRHLEITIPSAVTNLKYAHNMTYKPKDVIVTSVIGSPVTFNYALFDRDHICFSTTGSSVVRVLLGTF